MSIAGILGSLVGWKGYAAAAGAAFVVGSFVAWRVTTAFCNEDQAAALARANASLQAEIARLQLVSMANSAAIASKDAVEAEQAAKIAELEEQLKHVTPEQDCLPDPSLQQLLDGLR